MASVVSDVTGAGPYVTADGPDQSGRSTDQDGPALAMTADRSAVIAQHGRPVRSWPLLVLAAPAAVAVWSGWVGIGQMTGFGEIHPLPGIWDSVHLDTAVTLPIGVEAYAAFALRVWLTSSLVVSEGTRWFARRSAIGALVLGMAGQVAYHLLAQAGVDHAPWEVTTIVACLPVLVLGMGSALAHMLRSDSGARYAARQSGRQITNAHAHMHATGVAAGDQESPVGHLSSENSARPPARVRVADAQAAAATVIASGQSVSRRSLRAAGLHGSNSDLGMLARRVRTQPRIPERADS